jgi:ABC-type multidrug transport system ATPase subunit
VELAGVGKRYGTGEWVLRDVDLSVPGGAVAAITGRNGSGKSTLLRMLVGLSRPTVGTVTGRPQQVGYVPDRFPPDDRMSALAFLSHHGRIRGLGGRSAARAAELLDRLALAGGATTALRKLSKGNAQKVALAQALLVPPELLVLDEPWSGLDASAHGVLGEIIAEVARDGGAVVFTDHRESVTRASATARYLVKSGRLSLAPLAPATPAPTATLVLAPAPGGEAARLPDYTGQPGVRRVSGAPGLTLEVPEDRCDALLLTALRDGWSVRAVHRAGSLDVGGAA